MNNDNMTVLTLLDTKNDTEMCFFALNAMLDNVV